MSDETTYEDRAEYLRAVADPQYAASGRYRDQVAAKLERSVSAGTVTPLGQYTAHGDEQSFHTRTAHREPEGIYGAGSPMPKADPVWAEAAKVGSGFFDGPEAIARAMGAPQFDLDPAYREAVSGKVARSIREGWITPDLDAADPSKRFAR